jgi:hypothetical protein
MQNVCRMSLMKTTFSLSLFLLIKYVQLVGLLVTVQVIDRDSGSVDDSSLGLVQLYMFF